MNSSNKVALVTGGARRLGKHISLSLAESGYDIVLNYNESGKLISEKILKNLSEFNVNVTAVKCDLTKVKEIKKMFSVVSLKYGKLDLLVNNAAVFKKSDFFETTEKMYDNFLEEYSELSGASPLIVDNVNPVVMPNLVCAVLSFCNVKAAIKKIMKTEITDL